MVIKANKTAEKEIQKTQMKLVVQTPEQKREEVTNYIAQIKVKEIQINRIMGELKLVKNEKKELWEKAKQLAAECATGQIKLELESMLAEVAEGDEPDEQKSEFLQSLEDSLEEAAERNNDEAGE